MKNQKTSIEFDAEGIHYKLEMTASSLKKAERAGVNLNNLKDMPFTAPETVFWIACLANHPTISRKQATKLYKSLKRTADNRDVEYDEDGDEVDALTETLLVMLDEAADELSNRQGNVSWSVT